MRTSWRKQNAIPTLLSAGLICLGAIKALHCTDVAPVGTNLVRKAGALTTDYAAGWWPLARTDGGTTSGPALATIVTITRGTEAFFVSASSLLTARTRSNVELIAPVSTSLTAGQDASSIAVASADGGTSSDVFWRDPSQAYVTRSWNGSSFTSNTMPVGSFRAGPGAAGTSNRVDVFGVGQNHTLWHATRTGTAWTGWTNELGAPSGLTLASVPPAAVWRLDGVLHVFALASDGAVWTRRYQNGWTAWTSLGGTLNSGPAVTLAPEPGSTRLDVFAAGGATVLRRWSTDGGVTWAPSGWESVVPAISLKQVTIDGSSRFVAPSALSRADQRIDLFARDSADAVQLMTIRPAATFAPGSADRTIATSCSDMAGWENTAEILPGCGASGQVFLSNGASQRILRANISCFDGAGADICNLPIGLSTSRCAPTEIRFPGNPNYNAATDVPLDPSVMLFFRNPNAFDSNDNQIVRLSDGSLIASRLSHICSTVTCPNTPGPSCGSRTVTGAMLTFRSADCGATWTHQGTLDPCVAFGGFSACHPSGTGCDDGNLTGLDRQEVHADGMNLFATVAAFGQTGPGQVLMKSTDKGVSWTEWLADTVNGRIGVGSPVELTTVGQYVVRFAPVGSAPAIWVQSKEKVANQIQNPVRTLLPFSDCATASNLWFGTFGLVAVSSSADGDYVRISYPVGGTGAQVVKTGLVRINADRTATAVANSFTTIGSTTAGGSVLYPTLIEADRFAEPAGKATWPPAVLFWVESSGTPSDINSCVSSACTAWGNITVKARVFRGATAYPTVTVPFPGGTPVWTKWTGNGHYVQGAAYYMGSTDKDRFFVQWLYQGSGSPDPMIGSRFVDVLR